MVKSRVSVTIQASVTVAHTLKTLKLITPNVAYVAWLVIHASLAPMDDHTVQGAMTDTTALTTWTIDVPSFKTRMHFHSDILKMTELSTRLISMSNSSTST